MESLERDEEIQGYAFYRPVSIWNDFRRKEFKVKQISSFGTDQFLN